jgi:NitT/TauT family transport system substrate-binding protein
MTICWIAPRLLGIALACLIGVAAASSTSAQERVKVGGYFPPTFETTYQKYLVDGGFLKKQGYDGEFVGFTAGSTAVQAAASGSVDVACETPVSPIVAMERGAQFRIIEMIDADTTYIIATRDDVKKPEELRGKQWAVTQIGAISQTYAQLWLQHYGVGPNEVNWIPIGGGSARARALIAKQVDASLLTISDWLKVKNAQGLKILGKLADAVPPLPFSSCFVTRATLEKRPKMVQGFVNAAMDAARHAHTREGKEAYINVFQAENPNAFNKEELEELYDFYFNKNVFAVDPNGGMYADVLRRNLQLMVDAKSIKALPPLDAIWDTRFMDEYLGKNGWFDYKTKQGGKFFREIIAQ